MANQRTLRTVPGRHLAAAGLLAVAVASCDYDPGHADLPWRLSLNNKAVLADAGLSASEAQVTGALTTLFGTAQNPRHLITGDMYDAEEDPNLAGDLELTDEQLDAIVMDNRVKRFPAQLELIAAGRFSEVPEPLYAQDLWAKWQRDFAPLHTGTPGEEGEPAVFTGADEAFPVDDIWVPGLGDEATWGEAATALFENWYPSLRESAEMYRAQCLHCHGNEGGGDGPTAEFLEPRPRDYRLGKFKWVAVDNGKRPRRDDLVNILKNGAYFTAMPSFDRFSEGQLHGLSDYVRLLAMRGETETLLALEMTGSDTGDLPLDTVQSSYADVWEGWRDAEENYVAGEVDVPRWDEMSADEMVRRTEHGRELFMGTTANCFSCHGADGRGAEGATLPISLAEVVEADSLDADYERRGGYRWVERRNAKGEVVKDKADQPLMDLYRIKPDDWGNPSMPRNFTRTIFRGGSRPIDIFRRVKYGIGGTIMPASEASLTDDDLWDIVLYVKHLANSNDLAREYERKAAAAARMHEAEHGHGDHAEDHDSDEASH
jgi:mono/diheme cytochrome c family protein